MLEMGLDYLVDDKALNKLNIQLGEAHHGLGDERKKVSIFQSQSIIKIIKLK
jgi:hypothetical protein